MDAPLVKGMLADGVIQDVITDAVDHNDRPNVGDTSDPTWSPVMKNAWPHYIMGVSRMWLEMIDAVSQERGIAKDPTLVQLLAHYERVNDEVTHIWQQEGYHALLHHLNAIYGYERFGLLGKTLEIVLNCRLSASGRSQKHGKNWCRVNATVFSGSSGSRKTIQKPPELNGKSVFLLTRQNQVEQDPQDTGKADAAQGEFTIRKHHAADAADQDQGHNGQIAGLREVFSGLDQGVEADNGDGTEKQQHDPAHHRYRDGLEQGAHLADKGQGNGENGCPGHDAGIEHPGEGDGTGHLAVGGVGRPA
jgi:hypothetical protein